ncbi:hypothetical protein [Trichodesmium erythraeum]
MPQQEYSWSEKCDLVHIRHLQKLSLPLLSLSSPERSPAPLDSHFL